MKKRDFDYKFIYQNAQNIMIRNELIISKLLYYFLVAREYLKRNLLLRLKRSSISKSRWYYLDRLYLSIKVFKRNQLIRE